MHNQPYTFSKKENSEEQKKADLENGTVCTTIYIF